MLVLFSETVAPVIEVITWADMKRQLRLRSNDNQAQVEGLIKAATRIIESDINRIIQPSTWRAAWSALPSSRQLALPGGPYRDLSSVEYQSTAYVATAYSGVIQELPEASPPMIRFTDGSAWPPAVSDDATWVLRATYEVGYASAALVPDALRVAVMLKTEAIYLGEDKRFDEAIQVMTRPYWVPRVVVNHQNASTREKEQQQCFSYDDF